MYSKIMNEEEKQLILSVTPEEDREIVSSLLDIVPSWRTLQMTKLGYAQQYAETVNKLLLYIKSL